MKKPGNEHVRLLLLLEEKLMNNHNEGNCRVGDLFDYDVHTLDPLF